MDGMLAVYERAVESELGRLAALVVALDTVDSEEVRGAVRHALLNVADARRAQEEWDPSFRFEPAVVRGLHPVHLPEGMPAEELRRVRACVSLDG